MAEWFTITLPALLLEKVHDVLGDRVVRALETAADRFLQIMYLMIVLGSWSVVFSYGYPLMTSSPHVSIYHQYAGYLVFFMCMASWKLATFTDPGTITERTLAKFDSYPYDNLLFVDKICPTVGIRKLARSKYDRATNRHIPRFDHYCGWIHQPVGEENYRFFLLFLIVHICMCAYGTLVVGQLFRGLIVDKQLLTATFVDRRTGRPVPTNWFIVIQYLMHRHLYLSGVFALMAVMGFVLFLFLSFHLHLVCRNMTTNEYYKWKHVRDWHKNATKAYQKALKEGKVKPQGVASSSTVDHSEELTNVTCIGADAPSAPTPNKQKDAILNPGPLPANIYNVGIVENFREVIYPRSLRKDALQRWAEWWEKNGHNDSASSNNKSKTAGGIEKSTKQH
eukprot:scaffold72645_cov50-Attheya_sp.AAC.2